MPGLPDSRSLDAVQRVVRYQLNSTGMIRDLATLDLSIILIPEKVVANELAKTTNASVRHHRTTLAVDQDVTVHRVHEREVGLQGEIDLPLVAERCLSADLESKIESRY